MMMRLVIIACMATFCLAGCTSTKRSLAWKSASASFGENPSFEIMPVVNSTGVTLNEEILTDITRRLKNRFTAENLKVTGAVSTEKRESVSVRSEILQYRFQYFTGPPPAAGNTSGLCIMRTRLLAKIDGALLAEVTTFNKLDVGQGMLEAKDPETLLEKCAKSIAKEVAGLL